MSVTSAPIQIRTTVDAKKGTENFAPKKVELYVEQGTNFLKAVGKNVDYKLTVSDLGPTGNILLVLVP